MNASIDSVITSLNKYSVFVLVSHEDPDADCLGSQLSLGSWLKRRGKKVHLCSTGKWSRPEIADWQKFFSAKLPVLKTDSNALTIILDCSSLNRTGFQECDFSHTPIMVIDHHVASDDFGDIRYVDSSCPSTTLLVQRIIETAGDTPTQEEARYIFLGFCTDTGYFRHLEPGNGAALEAVARLVEIGASPNETYRLLSGGRKIGSRRLLGRTLDRVELFFEGRVAMTWETWKDWRELGSERDPDMLYQLLTSIGGIEAVVVIREQNDGMCCVGLRSVSNLDVSEIARFFGGGGHRKASGCTISGDRHDVIEHLFQIFATRLNAH